ncbi:hypothetical protein Ndes2437B_g08799 [Nannochloris sp. 'desiccata']
MAKLGYALLFFFLAVFSLNVFCAQAQRRLAPGPYSEEDEEIQRCIDLTTSAGDACTIESDISAQVFPRDSTELPTSEQTVRAISSLRGAALPSPNCCEQIRPFADARCVCLPGYQRILPIGGFDAAYFEGATTILTLACRIPFLPCIETPPEEPAAVAAAGAG